MFKNRDNDLITVFNGTVDVSRPKNGIRHKVPVFFIGR